LQWDQVNLTGGTVSVSYQEAFSLGGIATPAYSVFVTMANSTAAFTAVSSSGFTSTGCTINALNGGNNPVFYMAIGPKT
jgi:hypothetical protein